MPDARQFAQEMQHSFSDLPLEPRSHEHMQCSRADD